MPRWPISDASHASTIVPATSVATTSPRMARPGLTMTSKPTRDGGARPCDARPDACPAGEWLQRPLLGAREPREPGGEQAREHATDERDHEPREQRGDRVLLGR